MAKETINFTKAELDKLPLPEKGKRVEYWDSKKDGLILRISGSGSKVFYVYRWFQGSASRIKIGKYPDLSIEQARKKADEILGQLANGENPNEKKRILRKEKTFEELFTWYMESHAKPHKKTWVDDQSQFNLYLQGLAKQKVSKITKEDIRQLHAYVGDKHGKYSANRMLALIRCVFNRAIDFEIIRTSNPAEGIKTFKEHSRDRRLTPGEMPAFIQAVLEEENETLRDFILMSLFTGARRSNLQAMRWDQVDLAGATWRIPETKNGTSQTIPLLDAELEILKRRKEGSTSPWVFPGTGKEGHLDDPKKGWKRILERAEIEDLHLHDLRRTLGSFMVDTGASLPVIGKTLNHLSQEATKVYARLSTNPIREAKAKALQAMQDAVDNGKAGAEFLDRETPIANG